MFVPKPLADLALGRRLFGLRALDELDDLLLVSDILTDIDYEMWMRLWVPGGYLG
jgi:hypothetical protein